MIPDPPHLVGRSVRRLEDPDLLTGRGRFVDDVTLPRTLHAAFVRSPFARAQLIDIDTSEAMAHREVNTVLTGDDLASICTGWKGLLDWPGMVTGIQRPLATTEVRYVGEPIAIVVASNRHVAEDAAALVRVNYETLEPIIDPIEALQDDQKRVHQELGSNLCFETKIGEGDVESAFTEAYSVVEVNLQTGRHTAVAMEPRGLIANFNTLTRSLEVHVSTQAPHMLQEIYADLFEIPLHAVRVISKDVGGSFGMKSHVYSDEIAVIGAAMLVGQPIKWIQDRYESFVADIHSRDERINASLAITADGQLLGLQSEVISDIGAYSIYPRTSVNEGVQTVSLMPGPYRVPAYSGKLRVAFTNKAPLGSYRAVGHPTAILAIESLMDEAARALNISPALIRQRNLLRRNDLPYRSSSGLVYDSGSYHQAFERLLELVGDVTSQRDLAARRGHLFGIGLVAFTKRTASGAEAYPMRGAPITAHDQVGLRLEADGTVTVLLGTFGQGQGLVTTAAQVVADHLGVRFDDIKVVWGDTSTAPHGSGVWGSRSAVFTAGAAAAASRALFDRIRAIAAAIFEANPADIDISESTIRVRGTHYEMSVGELSRRAHRDTLNLPDELEVGLAVIGEYRGGPATFSNGAHAAMVEIDAETGRIELTNYIAVEDSGTLINPDIVDGQIRGGIAQGIGGALLEHLVYDDQGQLLSTTLMDYLVPSATDMPDIYIEHIETPSPLTSLGTKGAGESGTAGAPAAVHCAVNNALAEVGARVWRQPISPEIVLMALEAANDGSTVD